MIDQVWQDFEAGKRTALARAISIVENRRAGFLDLLNHVYPRLGRAHRIGLTGPPGVGISTAVPTASGLSSMAHKTDRSASTC